MSWTDVNLIEVKTTLETLPEQNFKFQVLGATKSKFDEDEVQVKVKVAEGPFAGTFHMYDIRTLLSRIGHREL